MNRQSLRYGLSLIEVLVYIAVLAIASAVVVAILLSLARGYAEVRAAQAVQRSALASLERVSREIRFSDTVNTGASTLGVHPGTLVLERTEGGSTDSIELYLDSGALRVRENGVDGGPLTTERVEVTNLVFHVVDSAASQGVRLEFELEAVVGSTTKRESFYSFASTRKP